MFRLLMRIKPTRGTRASVSLIRLVAGILAWGLGSAFAAGQFQQLELAADLLADAQSMKAHAQPMVILFSQRNCNWCDRARTQLAPLVAEFEPGQGALFRQVDIDRDAALTDFAGNTTTHRRFAREHGARFTPTLMVFGPDGQTLGEPILGMRLPDFYNHYVMLAIEHARARIQNPTQEARP